MSVDEIEIDSFWELIKKKIYDGEEKKKAIFVSIDEAERFQLIWLGKSEIGDFLVYWIECWGIDEDLHFLKQQFMSVDFEAMSVSLSDGTTLAFEVDEDPFEE
ncbi:hypothetical protein [Pseudomonas synxantha]|uniref:hypothetical protein n=1 Tax=Pseudomonas synxantha TaxID=47883 RepID=UPI00345C6534